MFKICFKCQENLPIEEFYKHSAMGDGYLNKCKTCTKKDVRNHRELNHEKICEYDRKRFKRPERKEKIKKYTLNSKIKEPEKHKARNMVSNAIRDGKLIKQSCSICGNKKSEAHHHDYSRPLDVVWLCFVCHRKEHGQNLSNYSENNK